MIGIIEYKHDAETPAIPVGIGNARLNSRNIIVEAVRNLAKPKRDGKQLPVKTESVYFTLKGAMSYSDANWNALNYSYLRHTQNTIRNATASRADHTLYSVKTIQTKAELQKYLESHGLSIKFDAPDAQVVSAVNLGEGEYTMAAILQLAGIVGTKEKIAVSDVKVKIGAAARTASGVQLNDEELRNAFKIIMNNIPAVTANIMFKKNGAFSKSIEQLNNAIDHKIPTNNFSVTVAKK